MVVLSQGGVGADLRLSRPRSSPTTTRRCSRWRSPSSASGCSRSSTASARARKREQAPSRRSTSGRRPGSARQAPRPTSLSTELGRRRRGRPVRSCRPHRAKHGVTQQPFDAINPPFDRLTHDEINELRAALDIGYFRPGEAIVERRTAGPSTCTSSSRARSRSATATRSRPCSARRTASTPRAVVHGAAGEHFIAAEETLCYLIPPQVVLGPDPAQSGLRRLLLFRGLAQARRLRRRRSGRRASRPSCAPGCGTPARLRPCSSTGDATIEDAGRRMRDRDINAAVRPRRRAHRHRHRHEPVQGGACSSACRSIPRSAQVCHFDVSAVGHGRFHLRGAAPDDAAQQAAARGRARAAVTSASSRTSTSSGLVAGNSQLIPGRIDRARSIDDLARGGAGHPGARSSGSTAGRARSRRSPRSPRTSIAGSSSSCSRWSRRPRSATHGCLMIMGSEGRGEQTVRTDQDNGLLLAGAGAGGRSCDASATTFSEALDGFGFPPCPGNVMVRNPLWSQPVDGFIRQIKAWVMDARRRMPRMNLAIFFDAVAVTGRPALLARAKTAMVEMMRGEGALLARFAYLIETFDTPRARHADHHHGEGRGRLGGDRHQEGRHLPDRPRHAHPGDRRGILAHTTAGGSRRWSRPDRFEPILGASCVERVAGIHGVPPALAAAGHAARLDRKANPWC